MSESISRFNLPCFHFRFGPLRCFLLSTSWTDSSRGECSARFCLPVPPPMPRSLQVGDMAAACSRRQCCRRSRRALSRDLGFLEPMRFRFRSLLDRARWKHLRGAGAGYLPSRHGRGKITVPARVLSLFRSRSEQFRDGSNARAAASSNDRLIRRCGEIDHCVVWVPRISSRISP